MVDRGGYWLLGDVPGFDGGGRTFTSSELKEGGNTSLKSFYFGGNFLGSDEKTPTSTAMKRWSKGTSDFPSFIGTRCAKLAPLTFLLGRLRLKVLPRWEVLSRTDTESGGQTETRVSISTDQHQQMLLQTTNTCQDKHERQRRTRSRDL